VKSTSALVSGFGFEKAGANATMQYYSRAIDTFSVLHLQTVVIEKGAYKGWKPGAYWPSIDNTYPGAVLHCEVRTRDNLLWRVGL
jgi:hypothetical protein